MPLNVSCLVVVCPKPFIHIMVLNFEVLIDTPILTFKTILFGNTQMKIELTGNSIHPIHLTVVVSRNLPSKTLNVPSRSLPKTKHSLKINFVFFTQIECLLNSKPLVYRKTSKPTEEVLTSGHFLIRRNLTSVPESSNFSTIKLSAQYRANRQRIKDFWRIWSVDYLNHLRCRSKWLDARPNLSISQIVLYKESSSSPSKWPLTPVTCCFPDTNNVVGTVKISIIISFV